jgi:anti-sigma B factor antagonist
MPAKPQLTDSLARRRDALRPAFHCSWASGGLDAAWVHVAGELDIATTPQLDRALREAQSQVRLVVLDLREVAFIDTSGVHAIVDASSRSRQIGDRLLLLSGTPGVDRVFTLTGTSDEVVNGDIHAIEPSVRALMELVKEELAA